MDFFDSVLLFYCAKTHARLCSRRPTACRKTRPQRWVNPNTDPRSVPSVSSFLCRSEVCECEQKLLSDLNHCVLNWLNWCFFISVE